MLNNSVDLKRMRSGLEYSQLPSSMASHLMFITMCLILLKQGEGEDTRKCSRPTGHGIPVRYSASLEHALDMEAF